MDKQLESLSHNVQKFGINLADLDDPADIGILALLDPNFPADPPEIPGISQNTPVTNSENKRRRTNSENKTSKKKKTDSESVHAKSKPSISTKKKTVVATAKKKKTYSESVHAKSKPSISTKKKTVLATETETVIKSNRKRKGKNNTNISETNKKKIVALFEDLIDKNNTLKKATKETNINYQKIIDAIQENMRFEHYITKSGELNDKTEKIHSDIAKIKNHLDVVLKDTDYDEIRTAVRGDKSRRVTLKRFAKDGKYLFKCHYCDFSKPSTGAVETHMVDAHEYPMFSCSFCNFSTKNSRSLYLHNIGKHDYNTSFFSRK